MTRRVPTPVPALEAAELRLVLEQVYRRLRQIAMRPELAEQLALDALATIEDAPTMSAQIDALLAMSENPDSLSNHPDLPNKEVYLSDRKVEIVRLLAEGLSYQQVATRLGVALNTIKFHVITINRELSTTGMSRIQMIQRARDLGLL